MTNSPCRTASGVTSQPRPTLRGATPQRTLEPPHNPVGASQSRSLQDAEVVGDIPDALPHLTRVIELTNRKVDT